ncbi:hypothetical protein K2173_012725 [Erythroxylum novogranatense]|uniref:Uncharacterized protein n=1 Tax=Erythroxylum novogranatense TaxID=1862640 RepID=A0AAV8SS29_9ROSI|nr:hypothetical protein K2173_012725 [Erythroxylum novogranatense]
MRLGEGNKLYEDCIAISYQWRPPSKAPATVWQPIGKLFKTGSYQELMNIEEELPSNQHHSSGQVFVPSSGKEERELITVPPTPTQDTEQGISTVGLNNGSTLTYDIVATPNYNINTPCLESDPIVAASQLQEVSCDNPSSHNSLAMVDPSLPPDCVKEADCGTSHSLLKRKPPRGRGKGLKSTPKPI